MPMASDINFNSVAEKSNCYSGADLAGLVKEAALIALLKEKDVNIIFINLLIK